MKLVRVVAISELDAERTAPNPGRAEPPTETEKAYLAGFVDGEGHITISRRTNPSGSAGHFLEAAVTNNDAKVLERLQEIWGGSLNWRHGRKENAHPSGQLKWTTRRAAEVLTAIEPYLITKADRCRLALEFQSLMAPTWNRSRPVDREAWEAREAIRATVSSLNSRPNKLLPNVYPEKPVLTCQWCGAAFTTYQKLRKYCSTKCNLRAGQAAYLERIRVEKVCPECGTTYTTPRKNQVYCSKRCAGLKAVDRSTYKPRTPKPPRLDMCVICGAEFKHRNGQQVTCSRVCGLVYRAARLTKPPVTKTCPDCGQMFQGTSSQVYCSPACGPHGRHSKKGFAPQGAGHH